jgi:hypothetical protein
LAAEQSILLRLLPDHPVNEGVEIGAIGAEIKVKHLRVVDEALLGLNLLHGIDEVELCQIGVGVLLVLLGFVALAVIAFEEVEGGREGPDILTIKYIVGEGVVRVGSLFEAQGKVDEIKGKGKIALLRVAVAAIDVGIALV